MRDLFLKWRLARTRRLLADAILDLILYRRRPPDEVRACEVLKRHRRIGELECRASILEAKLCPVPTAEVRNGRS